MDEKLLSGKRVLLIEDEMLLIMLIQDMLGDLGCMSITVAGTVETALRLVAENRFDLATLDVNLNGTRSVAVADALGARDIPFAFATGNDEHGFGQQFKDRPVLNKPFSADRFKEVIGQLLGNGVA